MAKQSRCEDCMNRVSTADFFARLIIFYNASIDKLRYFH